MGRTDKTATHQQRMASLVDMAASANSACRQYGITSMRTLVLLCDVLVIAAKLYRGYLSPTYRPNFCEAKDSMHLGPFALYEAWSSISSFALCVPLIINYFRARQRRPFKSRSYLIADTANAMLVNQFFVGGILHGWERAQKSGAAEVLAVAGPILLSCVLYDLHGSLEAAAVDVRTLLMTIRNTVVLFVVPALVVKSVGVHEGLMIGAVVYNIASLTRWLATQPRVIKEVVDPIVHLWTGVGLFFIVNFVETEFACHWLSLRFGDNPFHLLDHAVLGYVGLQIQSVVESASNFRASGFTCACKNQVQSPNPRSPSCAKAPLVAQADGAQPAASLTAIARASVQPSYHGRRGS